MIREVSVPTVLQIFTPGQCFQADYHDNKLLDLVYSINYNYPLPNPHELSLGYFDQENQLINIMDQDDLDVAIDEFKSLASQTTKADIVRTDVLLVQLILFRTKTEAGQIRDSMHAITNKLNFQILKANDHLGNQQARQPMVTEAGNPQATIPIPSFHSQVELQPVITEAKPPNSIFDEPIHPIETIIPIACIHCQRSAPNPCILCRGGNEVHSGVSCDECHAFPLLGPRFKSTIRNNYDLCQYCAAKPKYQKEALILVPQNLNNRDGLKPEKYCAMVDFFKCFCNPAGNPQQFRGAQIVGLSHVRRSADYPREPHPLLNRLKDAFPGDSEAQIKHFLEAFGDEAAYDEVFSIYVMKYHTS